MPEMRKMFAVVSVLLLLSLTLGCVDQRAEELRNNFEVCTNSGGMVVDKICCIDSNHFVDMCLIDACGCPLKNSHIIKVCVCPEGECWNGQGCVGESNA